MKEIRIAIIGCGGLRAKLLYTLMNNPAQGTRVVLGIDKNEKNLTSFEGKGVASANIHEINNRSLGINTVVIASPDNLHCEHACFSLQSGKNVYIEKPLGITPSECVVVMDEAKKRNRIAFVGHNLRYFTVFQKMKEIIDSGEIGDIKTIWCKHFISYGGNAYFQDWHAQSKNIGGLLIQKGCHDIDLMHWFAGSFSVKALAIGKLTVYGDNPKLEREAESASFNKMSLPTELHVHPDVDIEDVSQASFELSNGVTTQYNQCHFTPISGRNYTIIGTKGMIENIGDNPAEAVVNVYSSWNKFGSVPTKQFKFNPEMGVHGGADQRIVNDFFSVLKKNIQPTITLQAATEAVKAGYAATQSLREGGVLKKI